jgi:CRP-like cAMP-binding protein
MSLTLLNPFATDLKANLLTQKVMVVRSFTQRELLPLKLDQLWQIESGYVRTLTWDITGTITTLGIWGAGDIVGRSLSQIEPYQIECLTPVAAIEVSASSDLLHNAMLAHIQQLEILLNIVHVKQISSRLLKFLEWMAQRFGYPVQQGYVIDLRLTHQALSEVLGSTRVTITRLLNELEQAGKIKRLKKQRLSIASKKEMGKP